MKKEVIVLLLLGILLVSPLVSAQEQTQIYSGLNRFVDNIKLFFSSGDSKVILALDIREKEVNSAIVKVQNQGEDEAIKNLERAKEKLQIVQEKVSLKTADEVKESSSEVLGTINQEENLSESFEVYALEEEKTGLTAEWVIEVNGKEGQNLTNEVVIEQNRVVEIEKINGSNFFKVKGDAVNQPDAELVPEDQITGKVILSIPFAGRVMAFGRSQTGVMFLVMIPAAIIVYEELKSIWKEIKKIKLRPKKSKNK